MTEPLPAMRQRRAKINDVADLAGVSTKTVSRVLNNEPNVRAETRAKVKEAVAQLNYTPDFSARSLAGQRSYMFALFYDTISEGYLSKFQAGALDQCRESNYHLMVERCDVEADDVAVRVAETAARLRVDGVILLPPLSDQASTIQALQSANMPSVLISPGVPPEALPSVDMDDVAAATQVTEHLIALGHKRIGFIKGHPAHGASKQRFAGYARALDKADLPLDESLVCEGLFTVESGLEAGRALLSLANRPTAIFASNDDMAAGAARVAAELGLTVPEELSVIGFDDSLIARIASPPLTTVQQPVGDMAKGAVELLLAASRAHVRSERIVPTRKQFGFKIIARQSDGPIKK